VKSTNLRNKPVDRRRLSAEDRQSYRPNNRASALAKARQRKGQMAWDAKVTRGTQEQKPGTGGFTKGLAAQQERNRAKGAEVKRAKALRAEKPVY
tara:strand:- start:25 stop:309 length:285 start_codon:yes stop_codon:yes gene_type:complete